MVKLKGCLYEDSAFPLPDTYPREMKANVHKRFV